MSANPSLRASRLVLLSLGLTACSVDVSVPSDASMVCHDSSECPDGWRCNRTVGLCQQGDGNTPPVVEVEPATADGRAADALAFDVVLRDLEGQPFGSDLASLELSYSVDGATWCPVTLASGTTSDLATSVEGASFAFAWDLLADAANPSTPVCALTTQSIDDDGNGATNRTVVAYTPDVQLRAQATDDGSPAQSSQPALSAPFAVGDDPPTLSFALASLTLQLAAPIEFRITDSSADVASIEVEFQLPTDGPTTWRTPLLTGATDDLTPALPAAPPMSPLLIVWHTDATLGTPTLPGGVGLVNVTGVRLRARAIDQGLDGVTTYGPWASVVVDVHNQTPPVVSVVSVSGGESGYASSLVEVDYQVIDAQEDLVDTAVEYQLEGEGLWRPATAYPSALHSGRYDLASNSPFGATTLVRHTFVWDVGADLPFVAEGVRLRVRVADDTSEGTPVEVDLGFAVGVEEAAATEARYTTTQTFALLASSDNEQLASGDFNGDGILDVCAQPLRQDLQCWLGAGSGGVGNGQLLAAQSYAILSYYATMAVANLNGDAYDDVVVADVQDGYNVLLGGPTGLTALAPVYTLSSSTRHPNMALGDFNDDGLPDLVMAGETTSGAVLRVLVGQGDGTFVADPPDIVVSTAANPVFAVTTGDFDGDGADDLAYAVQLGGGAGTYDQFVALSVRVRPGIPQATGGIVATTETEACTAVGINDQGNTTGFELTSADFDGDGAAELVVADLLLKNVTQLRILSSAPDYAPLVNVQVPGSPRRLAYRRPTGFAADARLVVGNTTGQAYAFAFDAGASTLRLMNLSPASDVVQGQLDSDASVEWVEAGPLATLRVRDKSSTPGVPALSSVVTDTIVAPNKNVALIAGDLDADGLADALVGDSRISGSHVVAPFRTTSRADHALSGLAVGAPPTLLIPAGTDLQEPTNHIAFGDVTGDGHLDVVLSTYTRSFYVTRSLGDAVDPFGFATGVLVNAGTTGSPSQSADFDGDGRDDVIYYRDIPPARVSLSQGASGGITSWSNFNLAPGHNLDDVALGDLDGDGLADVVGIEDASPYRISVYFSTGNSAAPFLLPCTLTGAGPTSGAVIGDIDGDGREELVMATSVTGVQVLWGTQWERTCSRGDNYVSAAGLPLVDLALIDLNGDGIADVVGHSAATGEVYVQIGDATGGRGDGTFAIPTLLQLGSTSRNEAWGDITRDGLPDLFSVSDGLLRVAPTRRWDAGAKWTRVVDAAAVHATTPEPALDRFGAPRTFDVVMRPTLDRPASLQSAADNHADFVSRLRASGLASPNATWRSLTKTWQIEGDWQTDATETSGVHRRTLRSRLDGLGAAGALEVALPVYDAYAATDFTSPAVTVKVFARVTEDWTRAGAWPADAAYGDASAESLPTSALGNAVWIPTDAWVELPEDPDGDFTTDSGPRFFVDTSGSEPVVRLWLERLGVVQAFIQGP